MAVIYYPKSTEILRRDVTTTEPMVEIHLAMAPNAIFTFTSSASPTLSYTASWASSSISSSYALVAESMSINNPMPFQIFT